VKHGPTSKSTPRGRRSDDPKQDTRSGGSEDTSHLYKIATGAVLVVHRQIFKIICFANPIACKLGVDSDAKSRGKQNPAQQGRRVLLIYMTGLHAKSTLDPEQCSAKTDPRTRIDWLIITIKQLNHYPDFVSPYNNGGNEPMEDMHQPKQRGAEINLPPGGSTIPTRETRETSLRDTTELPFTHVPNQEEALRPI